MFDLLILAATETTWEKMLIVSFSFFVAIGTVSFAIFVAMYCTKEDKKDERDEAEFKLGGKVTLNGKKYNVTFASKKKIILEQTGK